MKRKNLLAIRTEGDEAYVYTPYNSNFVTRIRKKGKFDEGSKAWRVKNDKTVLEAVRKDMCDIFGHDDTEPEKNFVDCVVTFQNEEYACQDSIYFFGLPLARATGRDSGAKWQKGNFDILEGECWSGGSRQYWTTKISKGTRVKFYGISDKAIEKARTKWGDAIVIETIESGEENFAPEPTAVDIAAKIEALEQEIRELRRENESLRQENINLKMTGGGS